MWDATHVFVGIDKRVLKQAVAYMACEKPSQDEGENDSENREESLWEFLNKWCKFDASGILRDKVVGDGENVCEFYFAKDMLAKFIAVYCRHAEKFSTEAEESN